MNSRFARAASAVALACILMAVLPMSSASAASISSVDPGAMKRGDGPTPMVIHGSFLYLLSSPTVGFSNPKVTSDTPVYNSGDGTIHLNVSVALDAPTGPVTVTVHDDLGSDSCNCFMITPPPTVTGANPATVGQGATSKDVTLTGTGFVSGATVAISGVTDTPVASTSVSSDGTSLTVPVTVPGSAITGTHDITVINPDSQTGSCTGCLTISAAPRGPLISPAQRGVGLSDQNLAINGSGFTAGTTVGFSDTGVTVNTVSFVNGSRVNVNVDVAPDAAIGARSVTFTNPDGGTSQCASCFAVTGPTTATLTPPSALNGSVVATFSQPVVGLSSNNVFLTLTGSSTKLPATLTCVDSAGHATSCSTGQPKIAALHPASLLVAGQRYTAHASPASSPVQDFGGLPVAEVTKDFRAGTIQQGENPVVSIATWRTVSKSAALGGSYVVDHLSGASASFVFVGSSIVWYTNIGPGYGIADVYVDGVLKVIVNCYRSTTYYRARFSVSGFAYGRHTLRVVVRGAKGSSHGTGTAIAIDGFGVGTTTISTPRLTYTWSKVSTTAASAGAYVRSDYRGSSISFSFRGTAVSWYTVLNPYMGKANVYIDGVLKGWVDNYSSTSRYGFARTFGGLSDKVHTIRIVVLGTHRPGALGSLVAVDRWVVA